MNEQSANTGYMKRLRGFTLIELSIVLVIIALIAGGVLVGQDLVSASQIRSGISRIENMKLAIGAFKIKYNSLPGDLEANQALQFGMQSRSGAAAHGDGNRQWEGCSPSAVGQSSAFGCETALVWSDLSSAQLIEGSFVAATDNLIAVATGDQNQYFPKSGFRDGYFTAFSYAGVNFLYLTNIVSTNGSGRYTMSDYSNNLYVKEALSIDQKIDDGEPFTGSIIAVYNASAIVGQTNARPPNLNMPCVVATNSWFVQVNTCLIGNKCVNMPGLSYNKKRADDIYGGCQLSIRLD